MQQRIMDRDGEFWVTEEIRQAGPYEFYVEPYGNYYKDTHPKVIYTGEHRTPNKVLVVTPVNMTKKRKFSNN